MRLSILMAVHDGAEFLSAALDSILSQTGIGMEVIVVDDASSDATPALLAAYGDPRLRVVRNEENIGLTRSLNRGLALARGEFVARMDADDVCVRGRLLAQLAAFAADPTLVVVGGDVCVIDAQGRRRCRWQYPRTDAAIRWRALLHSPFAHPATMFRRAAVAGLGGYDENFTYSQDYELWSRLLQEGRGRNLGQVVLRYRSHDNNVTSRRREQQLHFYRMAKRKYWEALLPGALPLFDPIAALVERAGDEAARDCDSLVALYHAFAGIAPPGAWRGLAVQDMTVALARAHGVAAVPLIVARLLPLSPGLPLRLAAFLLRRLAF